MLKPLTIAQVESLLTSAVGPVSYIGDWTPAKCTAVVSNGVWSRKCFARDYLEELLAVERKAEPKPVPVAVSGKRTEPYAGPWPRGKHSHRCASCGDAVACYRPHCTRAQLTSVCPWCERKYR